MCFLQKEFPYSPSESLLAKQPNNLVLYQKCIFSIIDVPFKQIVGNVRIDEEYDVFVGNVYTQAKCVTVAANVFFQSHEKLRQNASWFH